jgi:hypothetical protein
MLPFLKDYSQEVKTGRKFNYSRALWRCRKIPQNWKYIQPMK